MNLNKDFGGFSLSEVASLEIAKRKGIKLIVKDKSWYIEGSHYKTVLKNLRKSES